jgi:hypothetical protein
MGDIASDAIPLMILCSILIRAEPATGAVPSGVTPLPLSFSTFIRENPSWGGRQSGFTPLALFFGKLEKLGLLSERQRQEVRSLRLWTVDLGLWAAYPDGSLPKLTAS